MCLCALSWVLKIRKMYFKTLTYLLMFFFISITEGGKKSSKDKIIIHVPYKIHKHHHTHTKYKVITIPTPKKENTVIYLKEEIQPIIQHIPSVQTHTEVSETHQKTPEPFIPPHQESAQALLEDLAKHKEESLTHADQQQQYSTIIDDQKPLESHSAQSSDFVPSFTFKPMIIPPHENFIPNFSFKPFIYPSQHSFTPKLIMNPYIHQSYDFLPKFTYQPMYHHTKGYFNPKYPYKPMVPPPKDLQDSAAHSSNQVYKTIISPRPKTIKSYKVKEENLEDHKMLMNKHRPTNINRIPVPSMKFNRKGKSYLHPGTKNQFKDMKNLIPSDPEYEYEHVGYLIIDGNSRKMVGKNFKDEIHLSR